MGLAVALLLTSVTACTPAESTQNGEPSLDIEPTPDVEPTPDMEAAPSGPLYVKERNARVELKAGELVIVEMALEFGHVAAPEIELRIADPTGAQSDAFSTIDYETSTKIGASARSVFAIQAKRSGVHVLSLRAYQYDEPMKEGGTLALRVSRARIKAAASAKPIPLPAPSVPFIELDTAYDGTFDAADSPFDRIPHYVFRYVRIPLQKGNKVTAAVSNADEQWYDPDLDGSLTDTMLGELDPATDGVHYLRVLGEIGDTFNVRVTRGDAYEKIGPPAASLPFPRQQVPTIQPGTLYSGKFRLEDRNYRSSEVFDFEDFNVSLSRNEFVIVDADSPTRLTPDVTVYSPSTAVIAKKGLSQMAGPRILPSVKPEADGVHTVRLTSNLTHKGGAIPFTLLIRQAQLELDGAQTPHPFPPDEKSQLRLGMRYYASDALKDAER